MLSFCAEQESGVAESKWWGFLKIHSILQLHACIPFVQNDKTEAFQSCFSDVKNWIQQTSQNTVILRGALRRSRRIQVLRILKHKVDSATSGMHALRAVWQEGSIWELLPRRQNQDSGNLSKYCHSVRSRKVESQNPSAEDSGTLSRFCNFRHVCPSCRMTRRKHLRVASQTSKPGFRKPLKMLSFCAEP